MPHGGSRKTVPQRSIQIGFLGTMSILAALMIFMYATTFQPETVTVLLSAVVLGVMGLVLAFIFTKIAFKGFDFSRFTEALLWTAFCVALIWIVNRQVPFTLGVTVLSLKWFAVLMGVMEELFFRIFLCNFIHRLTESSLFAIVISSFMWSLYHIARYGGSAGSYWIVFMAGLGLGFALLASRLGDSVIFAHAVVNYLAAP